MDEALYEQDFLVLSNEADIHHRASVFAMGNYLQEMARAHAQELGWGIDLLREKGQFWVSTRLLIEIDEAPEPGDTIHVQTWPKGTDRLFALRDFLISSRNRVIARATSSWALLGLPHRRPVSLDAMSELMFARKDIHAVERIPDKLPSPSGQVEQFKHDVRYSELDLNGHVNNTRYINWMLDTLPIDFHRDYAVREVQCNYLAEVFPDQTLHILREQQDETSYLFEVQNPDEKALFRGILKFK